MRPQDAFVLSSAQNYGNTHDNLRLQATYDVFQGRSCIETVARGFEPWIAHLVDQLLFWGNDHFIVFFTLWPLSIVYNILLPD